MKKQIAPVLVLLLIVITNATDLLAQTQRNVVVEHFTNTRCGICKSRNPGLFSNLSTSPEVYHISYHPSSPYSSCLLNKHDVGGNDDRTKYYGVYGSTPRVVVQGSAKGNGESFTSKDLFSAEQNKMTPLDIHLTTLQKGKDSLEVRIIIKNLATNSLKDMQLYAVAVEDTVFYEAPNGEKEHHNVFRKVLVNEALMIPSTVGDSVVFIAKTANKAEWNASRMYVMAFAQTADKRVEQVASSEGDADIDKGGGTNGVDDIARETRFFYPNPASNTLHLLSTQKMDVTTVVVSDVLGQTVSTIQVGDLEQNQISLQAYTEGTYYLQFATKSGRIVGQEKLVIIR